MSIRLDSLVLRGEFNHSRRNSVCGWIELDTSCIIGDPDVIAEYRFIHIDITGNFDGRLQGKAWRFEASRPADPLEPMDLGENFQDRQIGVLGSATMLTEHGGTTTLAVEWFGQNGQIGFELTAPVFEFEGGYDQLRDPFPAVETEEPWIGGSEAIDEYLQSKADFQDEYPNLQRQDFSAADDWFVADAPGEIDARADADAGSAPAEVEQASDSSDGDLPALTAEVGDLFDDFDDEDEAGATEWSADVSGPPKLRAWDEVIPGIDPVVKAMYEKWDEVTYGTHDEPLTWLFDGAFKLPRPDLISDEAEAEGALRVLLAQLARCGVAFDMCEHMDAKSAYRILVEDMLPEATVHPQLVSTGFVMHFSTFDHCPRCLAEIGEFGDDDPADVEPTDSRD